MIDARPAIPAAIDGDVLREIDSPQFYFPQDDVPFVRACRLLCDAGCASVQHEVGSFFRHLLETYSILRVWGLPHDVCMGGLLHSVYSTESFQQATFKLDERPNLALIVGERAERLAYLFHAVSRLELAKIMFSGVVEVRSISTRTGGVVEVSDWEVGALAYIEAANFAQQQCAADGGPKEWIDLASSFVWHGSKLTGIVTTLQRGNFAHQPVDPDDEQVGLQAYRDFHASLSEVEAPLSEGAKENLRVVADRIPFVGEPYLWLAMDEARCGNLSGARRFASEAALRFCSLGTMWDKRLSWNDVENNLVALGAYSAS